MERIGAYLRMSVVEIELTALMCAAHYDAEVRTLVVPGPLAVLTEARTHIRTGSRYADIPLRRGVLKLLVRATENPDGRGAHPYHRDLLRFYQEAPEN